MARFPFNVFLFHTYVAIFKINSFCQTYLSNPSGLQLSVMISDQRYKPEASSTWPLYDPFMQRQPGENLKQIKVTLEFFRRILISVFSSRLSLHSRLILHNLTLSLKAAESSMLVREAPFNLSPPPCGHCPFGGGSKPLPGWFGALIQRQNGKKW